MTSACVSHIRSGHADADATYSTDVCSRPGFIVSGPSVPVCPNPISHPPRPAMCDAAAPGVGCRVPWRAFAGSDLCHLSASSICSVHTLPGAAERIAAKTAGCVPHQRRRVPKHGRGRQATGHQHAPPHGATCPTRRHRVLPSPFSMYPSHMHTGQRAWRRLAGSSRYYRTLFLSDCQRGQRGQRGATGHRCGREGGGGVLLFSIFSNNAARRWSATTK